MISTEYKQALFEFADFVNKSGGRFNSEMYTHLFKIYIGECLDIDINNYTPTVCFAKQDVRDNFENDTSNTGTFKIVKHDGSDQKHSISKVFKFANFEQLKNEYKGDWKNVEMLVNGQFIATMYLMNVYLSVYETEFARPFLEHSFEFLKNEPLPNQTTKDGNTSFYFQINYQCLFDNYEKFASVDRAVKVFCKKLYETCGNNYDVYSRNVCIKTVNNTNHYSSGDFIPHVTAELNAHIASKMAQTKPAEPEYTIEQAKKDLETGQALIQKAVSFLTK